MKLDPKKSGVWGFGAFNKGGDDDSDTEYHGGADGIVGARADVLSEMNLDDVQENIMNDPSSIDLPKTL